MLSISRFGLAVFTLITATGPATAHAKRYEAPDVFRLERRAPAPKSVAEKTPSEYWRATGLTIQNYFDDVTAHCYDSLRAFRGCYEGLSDLAGASRAGGAILGTIEEQLLGHPNLGAVIENLPAGLKLFEVKKLQIKDRLELRDVRNQIRGIHARVTEKLFNSPDRIDFESLIRVMAGRALAATGKENEAWYAATLYNEFLGATDDPHSRLSPTEEELEEFAGNEQRFFGVGIQTHQRDGGRLFIYRVFRGSPAERDGVRRNDEILEINGVSPVGKQDSEISALIRGAEGTKVTFKVKRAGGVKVLTITRGAVIRKNLESWMVADTGTPIGYIRLGDFMDENASVKVRQAIASLESQGARGLILDLRGNGGGLLSQAFEISEFFVGRKPILSVMDLTLGRKQTYAGGKDAITGLPLAILIDAGSASASEITAGAIQDHNRGWIVGERSFGKGTVQGVARYHFKSYAGNRGYFDVTDRRAPIRYRKTMQRFYQPSGRTNQIQGILPSFAIDPFPGATEADKFQFREEDYYENALPAIERPWVETRTSQVVQINFCRDEAKADAWYKTMITSDAGLDPPDYRLYAAEDILRCHNQVVRSTLTLGE